MGDRPRPPPRPIIYAQILTLKQIPMSSRGGGLAWASRAWRIIVVRPAQFDGPIFVVGEANTRQRHSPRELRQLSRLDGIPASEASWRNMLTNAQSAFRLDFRGWRFFSGIAITLRLSCFSDFIGGTGCATSRWIPKVQTDGKSWLAPPLLEVQDTVGITFQITPGQWTAFRFRREKVKRSGMVGDQADAASRRIPLFALMMNACCAVPSLDAVAPGRRRRSHWRGEAERCVRLRGSRWE